jgi:PKD repeat protein
MKPQLHRTSISLLYSLFLWAVLSCKTAEVATAPKSPKKEITANPTVDGIAGAIVTFDAAVFTYTINVSATTDVKALKLTIPVSVGASISPNPATTRDYTNPVQYTITAEDGSQQVYIVKVVKAAAPPTASFTVQNNGCTASCTINFTNTSTNASSYTWTFGDGTQATDQNANKQYTAPGSYTVTLQVSGAGGMAITQQGVTVISSPAPTKVWDNSFGGYSTSELRSIVATSDGGFLLGGFANSGTSGNKTAAGYGGRDYWIVKINANGDKVWDKSFGGNNDEKLYSMVATPDGGFLLGGYSDSPISGNKTAANYNTSGIYSTDLADYWVVKINVNGDKIWDKSFGGNSLDYLSSIVAISDGGFLLGGYSKSGISGNKTAVNYGNEDYWIVKINTNGDKIWDKSFGGTYVDMLNSTVVTSDGGFLLGGFSDSPVSGNKTGATYGFSDYWVVKVNANGDKVWDKTLGGDDQDKLYSMVATSDGGGVLAGHSKSGISGNKTTAKLYDFDYWVVKINANGDKVWEKNIIGNGNDELYSMIATSDGSFLLGGYSNSGVLGDKTSPPFGYDDYWVV